MSDSASPHDPENWSIRDISSLQTQTECFISSEHTPGSLCFQEGSVTLRLSWSLKAMHSALDLHAKITTQTGRKPFRVIFPHCGRLYKSLQSQIQFPGAQMSCCMSTRWLFNLPVPQFFHSRKQGLCYWPPLEFWPSLLSENIYVSIHWESIGVWKNHTTISTRVTSERPTQKSTEGILKESLWHPCPQTSGLNQSEAGPADAQVTAHQVLRTNAHSRPVTLNSMLRLPQSWIFSLLSPEAGFKLMGTLLPQLKYNYLMA